MQCSIKDIGRDDTLCSSLDRCSSAWRNPFPKVYTSESTVRPKDLYRLVALSCIIDDIINRKSRNWLCGRFGRNCFYSGANLSDGRIVRFTNPLSIVIWTQIEWLWCESMTVQCPPQIYRWLGLHSVRSGPEFVRSSLEACPTSSRAFQDGWASRRAGWWHVSSTIWSQVLIAVRCNLLDIYIYILGFPLSSLRLGLCMNSTAPDYFWNASARLGRGPRELRGYYLYFLQLSVMHTSRILEWFRRGWYWNPNPGCGVNYFHA